jgi:hypothetical protein
MSHIIEVKETARDIRMASKWHVSFSEDTDTFWLAPTQLVHVYV